MGASGARAASKIQWENESIVQRRWKVIKAPICWERQVVLDFREISTNLVAVGYFVSGETIQADFVFFENFFG